MFSLRTGWSLEDNALTTAMRRLRAEGHTSLDLTIANPTDVGITRDPQQILPPLSDPQALSYEPEPFGMLAARESVAEYYADHGAEIDAVSICMTVSTSEAYSYLFRLLCDPGDEVLVARPSYPLFEFIARLDGVVLREYPLIYEDGHGWLTDLAGLERVITLRTKAVVLVHPNNPTGHFTKIDERARILELCKRHGLGLIVDEVFLDYAFTTPQQSFASGPADVLTFVLSGISKVCALPQMKASWIVIAGPQPAKQEAVARLEVIADTFLSMNAPVQHALRAWLRDRHSVQDLIRKRTRSNLEALRSGLAGTMAGVLLCEGGWTAVLRVPRTVQGREFAFAALDAGVVVQPGEFYGMPPGRAVISLLTEPEVWRDGVTLLRRLCTSV